MAQTLVRVDFLGGSNLLLELILLEEAMVICYSIPAADTVDEDACTSADSRRSVVVATS